MLPKRSSLGDLHTLEVYETYDGPELFSCVNERDEYFIVVHVDHNQDSEIWLYAPISYDGLLNLRAGKTILRDAFTHPQGHLVWLAFVSKTGSENYRLKAIKPAEIEEKWLPAAGQALNVNGPIGRHPLARLPSRALVSPPQMADFSTLSPNTSILTFDLFRDVIGITPVDVAAQRIGRAVLDLRFTNVRDEGSHLISIKALGGILNNSQGLIDAIGQAKLDKPTLYGSIPETVLARTRLRANATFPSSFGLRLESDEGDLFGDSPVQSVYREFVELFSNSHDHQAIAISLGRLGPRVSRRFKAAAEALQTATVDGKIELGLPKREGIEAGSITYRSLAALIRFLESELAKDVQTVKAVGRLVSVSMKTHTFRLEGLDNDQVYAGRIAATALTKVDQQPINGIFEASVEVSSVVNVASGEEQETHVLKDLVRLAS